MTELDIAIKALEEIEGEIDDSGMTRASKLATTALADMRIHLSASVDEHRNAEIIIKNGTVVKNRFSAPGSTNMLLRRVDTPSGVVFAAILRC